MRLRLLIFSVLIILLGVAYKNIFDIEARERMIVEGKYYDTDIRKATESLEFSIYPKEDYAESELGKRRLIFEKYDTKVYIEPMLDKGDKYWVWWSFDNSWNLFKGTCFTFEAYVYENNQKFYTDVSPVLNVTDQNGRRIYESWGGGGSTYNYGFEVEKEKFKGAERIDVKFSNFNIMEYKLNLLRLKK